MRRFGSIISREGSLPPPLGGLLTAAPSSRGGQGQSGGAPMQRTSEAWQPTSLADAVAAAAAGGWPTFPHADNAAAQQGGSFMDQGDYEDSFLLGEFGSSDFEDEMDVTGSGRGSGGIEEATSAHPGGAGGGGGDLDMMLDDLFPLPPGGGGDGVGAGRGAEGSLFPLPPHPQRRAPGKRPAAAKRMPGGREFGEVRGGLSRRCLAPYIPVTATTIVYDILLSLPIAGLHVFRPSNSLYIPSTHTFHSDRSPHN